MADNTAITPGSGETIRDKDRAGVKTQIVGLDLTPNDATEKLMGAANPLPTSFTSPAAGALGIFALLNPYGGQRVSVEPTQLFFDPFDGAAVDTAVRWATAGTQVPTQSNGAVALAPTVGVNLTNTSSLISQPSFVSPGLGFLSIGCTVTLEAAQTNAVNVHRFWGKGQVTAFAYATPVTDGVGFEVEPTTGALQCVVYVGGTKYVINSSTQTLVSSSIAGLTGNVGTALPAGAVGSAYGAPLTWKGGQHRYAIFVRSDVIYWFIEGTEVPVAVLSYLGPNVQALPLRVAAATNPAATSLANTFQVGAITVCDSTAQNHTLSDSTFPWRRTKVSAPGELRVASGVPTILQKKSAVSTGSITSQTAAFSNPNIAGNSIVVCVGMGVAAATTVTDSAGNTYVLYLQQTNSPLSIAYWIASNILPSANNVVTVTNTGAAASMATEIYEVDGLAVTGLVDTTVSANGTGTNPVSPSFERTSLNGLTFAALAIGTAAQTITPGTPLVNDSGQLNPTTPAGLFSFVSASGPAGVKSPQTLSFAQGVSEPYLLAAIMLRAAAVNVDATAIITDGTHRAAVKAASTAAVATDTPLVVALHPTSPLPPGTNNIGSVAPQTAGTGTITSPALAITSFTVLAANAARKGAAFYNDSVNTLYLGLTASAVSTTAYTVQIPPGGYYELPTNGYLYTGQVTGISAVASGNVRVTELT